MFVRFSHFWLRCLCLWFICDFLSPVSGSIILAGVLLKLVDYGLLLEFSLYCLNLILGLVLFDFP